MLGHNFTKHHGIYLLGVKVRNIKMNFHTGGTMRRVMNTNDEILGIFISAKSFSHPV